MTDAILALIPQYGLLLLFGVVTLACLAAPLPSSMLVLASGSFAATGDLALWQVIAVAFVAFVIGDQLAYGLARIAGPPLLAWIRSKARLRAVVERSEALLEARGQTAVLLSHTILSPTCPYISYLSGAGGMGWRTFSIAAIPGAAIWTLAYVGLGHTFASQLTQVAEILSDFVGVILAGVIAIFCAKWLRDRWQRYDEDTGMPVDGGT